MTTSTNWLCTGYYRASGRAAAGIGFAIPSNIVTDIAGQLVTNYRVTNSHRAALGATVTGARRSRCPLHPEVA